VSVQISPDEGFQPIKLHSLLRQISPEIFLEVLEKNRLLEKGYFQENYFFEGRLLDTGVYTLHIPLNDDEISFSMILETKIYL